MYDNYSVYGHELSGCVRADAVKFTADAYNLILTVIGRQLINCAFTFGRRCARAINNYSLQAALFRAYMHGVWQ